MNHLPVGLVEGDALGVGGGALIEVGEETIVKSRVILGRNEGRRSLIGKHQSIGLEGRDEDLCIRRVGSGVEGGLEAETGSVIGLKVVGGRSSLGGRRSVGSLDLGDGEAQGMVDGTGRDLRILENTRENGESRCIRRSPSIRSLRQHLRCIEDGRSSSGIRTAATDRRVRLRQRATRCIKHDHMAISFSRIRSRRSSPTFNRSSSGYAATRRGREAGNVRI